MNSNINTCKFFLRKNGLLVEAYIKQNIIYNIKTLINKYLYYSVLLYVSININRLDSNKII